MTATRLIAALGLTRHPEGGWYRELFRSPRTVRDVAGGPERRAITVIHYLLEAGDVSRWHVVGSDETWHFHAGAPLELHVYAPGAAGGRLVSGRLAHPEVEATTAVAAVPAGAWQAARSTGAYSLVSCCVAPGFEFADFRFVADLPGHAAHFCGALESLRTLL